MALAYISTFVNISSSLGNNAVWGGGDSLLGTVSVTDPYASAGIWDQHGSLDPDMVNYLIPTGAVISSAVLSITHSMLRASSVDMSFQAYDNDGFHDVWDSYPSGDHAATHTRTLPGITTQADLIGYYVGWLWTANKSTPGAEAASNNVSSVIVAVTFTETRSWYFNSLVNQYQFTSTDPGSPWTIAAPPDILVTVPTLLTPSSGPTIGGTVI